MASSWKSLMRKAGAVLAATAMLASLPVASANADEEYPDVMLGVFTNSSKDSTDVVYMSTDGVHFEKIAQPFTDLTPGNAADGKAVGSYSNGRNYPLYTFNCPSIIWHDGYFWMLANEANSGNNHKLRLVVSFSKDLVHWSDQRALPVDVPGDVPSNGSGNQFDAVAADWNVMPNGKIAVVTSLGRYGAFHGQPEKDTMIPYMTIIDSLSTTNDPSVDPKKNDFNAAVASTRRVNLPTASNNRIDGSWYFEGNNAYLSIKKNGVTNEIWRTNADLANPSWTLVNGNVVTGYEAPSLTKLGDRYHFFTDELATFTPDDHVRQPYYATGTWSQTSTKLESGWSGVRLLQAYDHTGRSYTNNARHNDLGDGPRHGTVITVTDPAAKKIIWQQRANAGWSAGQKLYEFNDVRGNTPHVDDITWLASSGITSGYTDGTFRGSASVVRQDMAAFLYRLAGSPAFNENAVKNPFVDVNRNTPHYKEILWLASTGISTGWNTARGKEFRGMQPVVRQDMAAFLKRLSDHQKATPALGAGVAFSDVNATTPHSADISWLAKTGVTTGWKKGNATEFRGMNAVQRQDMAAFLHRMKTNVLK